MPRRRLHGGLQSFRRVKGCAITVTPDEYNGGPSLTACILFMRASERDSETVLSYLHLTSQSQRRPAQAFVHPTFSLAMAEADSRAMVLSFNAIFLLLFFFFSPASHNSFTTSHPSRDDSRLFYPFFSLCYLSIPFSSSHPQVPYSLELREFPAYSKRW